ncbi:MAG: alpha/beta fold hydrolase [Jatrophihabitans sp.]|uniref:alpha/beta fold hydrolase n=1 Tax=Jatrophihabitans sp. TaxID=1932789 RepID=UPI00390EFD48
MTTFCLIPGAGGDASYWSRVTPELERHGHAAIAVDIPEDDRRFGLPEYAELVEGAIGDRHDVVLVAQSMGGFTAPMVTRHKPVRMIVLVNAMVPLPGETPGDWWDATGSIEARRAADLAAGRSPDFDMDQHFLHDIDADTLAWMQTTPGRAPSDTPFGQPCEFDAWPDVPIKVLVGRDDRFFPADFQWRVAKDRLGIEADEIPGGHLVALANPVGLAERLVEYAADLDRPVSRR